MNSKQELEQASLSTTASSIFQGYDNVTGQALSAAVYGNQTRQSGTSELQYIVTKSIQDTYQALNISSSVSAGYAGFSGEAKVTFVNQLNLTKESLCIIVKASDKQNVIRTDDIHLKDNIESPKTKEEVIEFVKKYGDSFISELVTGAEYYAVYAFICETSDQRTSLESQLTANGISLFGGELSASLQVSLERVCKASSSSVSFQQLVSGLTNPHLPSQDAIVDYALHFFDLDIDNPAIISYETTSYDHAQGFSSALFDQIRKNVIYFTNKNGDFTTKGISINELINQCNNLKSIYSFYNFDSDTKVSENKESAEIDLKALSSQQTEYTFDPMSEFTLPNLPSLNEGNPVLQYDFKDSDAYGKTGGGEFNDIDQATYIQKMTRLIKVKLSSGTYVDKLIATYQCSDPAQPTYTKEHGGGGGGASHELQLSSNVLITSISGRSGKYVDKLTFTASNNQQISGGSDGGGPFTCEIPTDYFVAGFKGNSGTYLDQICIVYAKLLPAIWKK